MPFQINLTESCLLFRFETCYTDFAGGWKHPGTITNTEGGRRESKYCGASSEGKSKKRPSAADRSQRFFIPPVDLNNRRRDRNDVLETPRPAGGDTGRAGSKDMTGSKGPVCSKDQTKSLILAQDERWRRA